MSYAQRFQFKQELKSSPASWSGSLHSPHCSDVLAPPYHNGVVPSSSGCGTGGEYLARRHVTSRDSRDMHVTQDGGPLRNGQYSPSSLPTTQEGNHMPWDPQAVPNQRNLRREPIDLLSGRQRPLDECRPEVLIAANVVQMERESRSARRRQSQERMQRRQNYEACDGSVLLRGMNAATSGPEFHGDPSGALGSVMEQRRGSQRHLTPRSASATLRRSRQLRAGGASWVGSSSKSPHHSRAPPSLAPQQSLAAARAKDRSRGLNSNHGMVASPSPPRASRPVSPPMQRVVPRMLSAADPAGATVATTNHTRSMRLVPPAEGPPPMSSLCGKVMLPLGSEFSARIRSMMLLREQMELLVQKQKNDEAELVMLVDILLKESHDRLQAEMARAQRDPRVEHEAEEAELSREELQRAVRQRDRAIEMLSTFRREGGEVVQRMHDALAKTQTQNVELSKALEVAQSENLRLKSTLLIVDAHHDANRPIEGAMPLRRRDVGVESEHTPESEVAQLLREVQRLEKGGVPRAMAASGDSSEEATAATAEEGTLSGVTKGQLCQHILRKNRVLLRLDELLQDADRVIVQLRTENEQLHRQSRDPGSGDFNTQSLDKEYAAELARVHGNQQVHKATASAPTVAQTSFRFHPHFVSLAHGGAGVAGGLARCRPLPPSLSVEEQHQLIDEYYDHLGKAYVMINVLRRELRKEKMQRLEAEEQSHKILLQHQKNVDLLEQRLSQLGISNAPKSKTSTRSLSSAGAPAAGGESRPLSRSSRDSGDEGVIPTATATTTSELNGEFQMAPKTAPYDQGGEVEVRREVAKLEEQLQDQNPHVQRSSGAKVDHIPAICNPAVSLYPVDAAAGVGVGSVSDANVRPAHVEQDRSNGVKARRAYDDDAGRLNLAELERLEAELQVVVASLGSD